MKKNIIVILIGISISNFSLAQLKDQNKSLWPKIEAQMKPWTRWWWMGNAVDDQNLEKVLQQYHDAGLGGVEITPIYGAVGYENKYLSFLSPQWISALQHTINKANALGMGVDMNTGTGWPFGGPQIKPENAATKLIIQQYKINAGDHLKEKIQVKEAKQENAQLQAVTAYGPAGEVENLLNAVQKDGSFSWSPKSGIWNIYAAFSGKTRQMVKRAAPGGEGFTLDHLDKKSVDVYLKRFTDSFQNKPQGIRSFFNDSYEVYGATWTSSFFTAFKKNRGYDLSGYLNALESKETTDSIARLKSDYRETMDELLLQNFTQNWTDWAHGLKSLTKNQSHGSPGNLLDLYGAVDIPETETFGSSAFDIPGIRRDSADIRNVDPDPMMSKFASSAAHTNGKNLVSSETFTWLTEHFKTSFSQCKPEVEQLFLAGVNHVFYHGTAYSPTEVPWPGWLFYASVEMNPNNSLWPHAQGLSNYISRCQSVLQAGKADNEILMYWPVYDVWNNAKGLDLALKVHDVDEWLHPSAFYKLAVDLKKVGYSFDFASDRLLAKSSAQHHLIQTAENSSPYQVLLIPSCARMSVETLDNIVQLAGKGATVIFQSLPTDVPGLNDLEKRREKFKSTLSRLVFSDTPNGYSVCKWGEGKIILAKDITGTLSHIAVKRETLTDTGLQFIRRKVNADTYYYLVNHTNKEIDTTIPINRSGYAILMNPQNGDTGLGDQKENKVRVQIKSGEALFINMSDRNNHLNNWSYLDHAAQPMKFKNPWSLHFLAGGPELPADQKLNTLTSWTDLGDPKLKAFSGTGVYTTHFNLPQKNAKEYVLKLNQVDESARVWINGKEVGILWSVPFEARIGKYLKKGENDIKIEVVNLMANRIRYMDQKKIEWRKYHEINFVNIDYKNFDASNWAVMPSGLIGPVYIIPYH